MRIWKFLLGKINERYVFYEHRRRVVFCHHRSYTMLKTNVKILCMHTFRKILVQNIYPCMTDVILPKPIQVGLLLSVRFIFYGYCYNYLTSPGLKLRGRRVTYLFAFSVQNTRNRNFF